MTGGRSNNAVGSGTQEEPGVEQGNDHACTTLARIRSRRAGRAGSRIGHCGARGARYLNDPRLADSAPFGAVFGPASARLIGSQASHARRFAAVNAEVFAHVRARSRLHGTLRLMR
jgi:hypothetical protein